MKNTFQRFFNKVEKGGLQGCWNWIGYIRPDGYGDFTNKGKSVKAHRYSYEFFVGKIPNRMVIDHLCRNRSCVNPKHLEVVSLYENIMRGEGIAAQSAKKKFCLNNHPLSGLNVYRYLNKVGRTRRVCRACGRDRTRGYRKQKKTTV